MQYAAQMLWTALCCMFNSENDIQLSSYKQIWLLCFFNVNCALKVWSNNADQIMVLILHMFECHHRRSSWANCTVRYSFPPGLTPFQSRRYNMNYYIHRMLSWKMNWNDRKRNLLNYTLKQSHNRKKHRYFWISYIMSHTQLL